MTRFKQFIYKQTGNGEFNSNKIMNSNGKID